MADDFENVLRRLKAVENKPDPPFAGMSRAKIRKQILFEEPVDPKELLLGGSVDESLLTAGINDILDYAEGAPGTFGSDSIDPSKVNVTQPADVVSFPLTVLNSATYTTLGSQVVGTPGIYIVACTVDFGSLATAANDRFDFRLLVDLNNKDNAYFRSPTTIFNQTITFVYIGPINAATVVQGCRGVGTGTSLVTEVIIRAARIG